MSRNDERAYDVYGIGNALVDFEYRVSEEFLRDNNIARAHTTLVDGEQMADLRESLDGHDTHRTSGGSAANTAYAVAAFGGRAFYACRVAADEDGGFFLRELDDAGVGTKQGQRPEGITGRCVSMVTPDAERSMYTFLGISEELCPEDLDHRALARSQYLHIEGYLCSSPTARAAVAEAREAARAEGVRVSLVISDPAMVLFFREGLEEMLGNGVDQLFCNEEEALTWTKTDRLDIATNELKDIAPHVNITLGARGSLVISPKQTAEVPGVPAQAVDTTGAGDMYAGACLYALATGASPTEAARFAGAAAAKTVSAFGARLPSPADYRALLAKIAGTAPARAATEGSA